MGRSHWLAAEWSPVRFSPRLGAFWPLMIAHFTFPAPDCLKVNHGCLGEGRRQQPPPASSPAPECGPRLTPLPRLASWEFTWYVRTPGVGSSFQDSGARKPYTRDICIKEAPTPMLLEESPPCGQGHLWGTQEGGKGRGQERGPLHFSNLVSCWLSWKI